jgi:alkyl sulfatase BDS1-like metallo-beta-lactamase superfamily hydrolase
MKATGAAADVSKFRSGIRTALAVGAVAAMLHALPASAGPQPSTREFEVPGPAPAEPATAAHNAGVLQELPFSDRQDYEDARRGFVATLPDVTLTDAVGKVVFSLRGFEFLRREQAPATVNPSLWRIAQLNMNNGLFKVTDRVYQVRGFDMANMTIVEGDTGLIVIDPLEAVETSSAALDLYYRHRDRSRLATPVRAVIYTHSHHDHYAGVRGVVSDAELANVQVLAPDGFLDAAVSENVYAGIAMSRRASFMYGASLPKGERGLVDAGLGKGRSAGRGSLIAPNAIVRSTGETRTIDGVQIEFVMAPETEAPAEMTLWFPQFGILDSAEIACPLLHNVLTLRGAQVRNAKAWASRLDELIVRYGERTDILIAQHNWPRWGRERVVQLLADQRDLYKFMHDQTLHLLNQGHTPVEIAELIRLPEGLANLWYVRGYYGTLSHDVKAIYQRYLGWFDGNPAHLDPLPPAGAARKYLEYMGGPHAVTARARQDFRNGEYRWVAELMNHVVFAYPEFAEGRHLQADALEQLGYQAESAAWRNFYLTGAQELRRGTPPEPPRERGAGADTLRAMSTPLLFDYWGVLLNADRASGNRMVLNWTFPGEAVEMYTLNLSNSALTWREGSHAPSPDAGFTLTRATLDAVILGETDVRAEVAAGRIRIAGNGAKLGELMAMFDTFRTTWPIVTP